MRLRINLISEFLLLLICLQINALLGFSMYEWQAHFFRYIAGISTLYYMIQNWTWTNRRWQKEMISDGNYSVSWLVWNLQIRNLYEIKSNEQPDDVISQIYLLNGLLSANFNWLPHKEVEKMEVFNFLNFSVKMKVEDEVNFVNSDKISWESFQSFLRYQEFLFRGTNSYLLLPTKCIF